VKWDDFLLRYQGFPQILTVIDWAYNDTGAPIHVGDVPEPGSLLLALMASGATGVLAWRRYRRDHADREVS
jgi:hypothetical protein